MASGIEKILKAIEHNKTSLGDNPALPPDEEKKLLTVLTKRYYDNIVSSHDTVDEATLSKLLSECFKEEQRCRPMLEELAGRFIAQYFGLEGASVIEFNLQLVNSVDSSEIRMFPEEVKDFSFDDIEDMKSLTGEIYKRRMLNALIAGASQQIGLDAESFIPEIGKINSNLPGLYKKILQSNEKLLFEKDTQEQISNKGSDAGKVDVFIGGEDTPVKINAQGVIFPILIIEGIKGVLELAISHGLPKDRKKALYVMAKADFKFAEIWDQRLGLVLWNRIREVAEATGHDCLPAVGINYLLMEIASFSVDEFNNFMCNVLAKTKKGITMLNELCDKIEYNKEHDEFDMYVSGMEIDHENIDGSYFDADNADDILLGDSIKY